MSVDRLLLESPELSEEAASRIKQACVRHKGELVATDTATYQYYNKICRFQDQSPIILHLRRKRHVSIGQRELSWVPCKPYITLNGSVAAAIQGHSVAGLPQDPRAAARWLIQEIELLTDCPLPHPDEWTCRKLTWVANFGLDSAEAVDQYLEGFRMARYPRRRLEFKEGRSVRTPGYTTIFTILAMGPEFRAGERKRLGRLWDPRLDNLQLTADRIVRVRVLVMQRKLNELFRGAPHVGALDPERFWDLYDRECRRFFGEIEGAVAIARTQRSVRARLQAVYGETVGRRLYHVWLELRADGETVLRTSRKDIKRLERDKADLAAAGCWWLTTELVDDTGLLIRADFHPTRNSPCRLTDESLEVTRALQEVSSARDYDLDRLTSARPMRPHPLGFQEMVSWYADV